MEVDQGDFFETGRGSRVNGKLLANCAQGTTVSLVGKVTGGAASGSFQKVSGGEMIEASDGVSFRVLNDNGLEIPAEGFFVEVVGSVADGGVKPYRITNFGEKFDLANYDALVNLAQSKYKGLF